MFIERKNLATLQQENKIRQLVNKNQIKVAQIPKQKVL